jgi:hypothetical protein
MEGRRDLSFANHVGFGIDGILHSHLIFAKPQLFRTRGLLSMCFLL